MAVAPESVTERPFDDQDQPAPCVGVLFVHGAGDHQTGTTLIEFGQALVAWLDGWLRHSAEDDASPVDGAIIGVTQILVRESDTQAPAHSYVRLRPKGDPGIPAVEHTWLLAESHWDDAFTPPSAKQVLIWAISVVPWVLITQLIGPLQRRARLVRPTPLAVFGYLWRVFVATIVSLIATFLAVALIIVTLILLIIPIDAVRDIVSKLQRFAETGVGDLYVVLTSTVQRAALTGAVQRDIQWLRDRGATRVAVVAHSQGGFVSYRALSDPWSKEVEMYLTFGSAIVRLTEIEHERKRSAFLKALVGAFGALIALRFLPATLLGFAGFAEVHAADVFACTIGALDPFLRLPLDGPEQTRPKARKLLRAAYRRRHERVSALRARGSVIVAATIAALGVLLFRPGELDGLGRRIADAFSALPGFLTGWIPNLADVLLPIQGIEMTVLGALAIAILSYFGLLIGSSVWGSWAVGATRDEYLGDVPAARRTRRPWSRVATMFYVVILVHLAVLAVLAIVGPISILDALGSFFPQRDEIVRAWARQFIVTLVVAGAAWALVSRRGR